MATNPYSPIAGTRANQFLSKVAPTKTAKKSKASPPPVSYLSSIPAVLSDQQARDQVMQLLAPIFAQQQQAINSAYDQRAASIRAAYDQLARYSQGVAPAVQGAYQSAAKDTAAFGKGFSDAVAQASSGRADAATAAIQAQGGPQTVTSGLANGGADALYAMGGAIPGSALEREGAAFGSAASFLPRTAAGYGADALSQSEAQRIQDIQSLVGDQPKTVLDMMNQLIDRSYNQRQDALKLALSSGTSPNASKLSVRTLANGQIQFFNPTTGRPVGPPQGPAKLPSTSSRTSNLQARTLSNGQVQWFDPATGRPVGAPQGPPKVKGQGSKASANLQARSLADGRIQWFNPKTGKAVGPPVGPPRSAVKKASKPPQRIDEGGRLTGRTDGVSSAAARKYKATAYSDSQGWHKNGEKDDAGNHYTWKEFLGFMVNSQGVPYDLAIRQLARFSPDARKALASGINALTGQSTKAATNPKGSAANAAIIQDALNAGPRSGARYVFGAAGNGAYDCSGYTMAMVQQHTGIQLPHQARAQFYDPRGAPVPRKALQPGDVVFFRSSPNGQGDGPPYHCGYYIGGGKYVEYYSSGKPARVSSLSSRSDYMGARRFGGSMS